MMAVHVWIALGGLRNDQVSSDARADLRQSLAAHALRVSSMQIDHVMCAQLTGAHTQSARPLVVRRANERAARRTGSA
jgi:hypothetical protein